MTHYWHYFFLVLEVCQVWWVGDFSSWLLCPFGKSQLGLQCFLLNDPKRIPCIFSTSNLERAICPSRWFLQECYVKVQMLVVRRSFILGPFQWTEPRDLCLEFIVSPQFWSSSTSGPIVNLFRVLSPPSHSENHGSQQYNECTAVNPMVVELRYQYHRQWQT